MKKPADQAVNPFQGIIIAALTPRRPNETSIDLSATLELVDYLGNTGASAIALLGSTGEFVHFAIDDRRHMTSFAVKRSRVPLLVNVSHSTLDGAVELAHEAEESGVGGVLVMPPYYFRYSQPEVRQFYLEFARAMHGRIPVYLYNIPIFTTEIAIATALDLMDTGQFAGIKDSSGSWEYLEQLQNRAPEAGFSLLVGSDTLYARARQIGADGAVSGVACAVPELMLAIEQAVAANESDRAAELSARVQEFVTQIGRFPFPVGIKEAARLRKFNVGAPATALSEQAARDLEAFRAWFHPWLASVLGECANRVKAG